MILYCLILEEPQILEANPLLRIIFNNNELIIDSQNIIILIFQNKQKRHIPIFNPFEIAIHNLKMIR